MAPAGISSSSTSPPARSHYSGLWLGEAHPDPSLTDVPVNPIKWSLSLLSEKSCPISAFGAGFFDDAGDIPGQPVLFFTLQGSFDPDTGKVSIKKQYTSQTIAGYSISYEGSLKTGEDGQPQLSGKWSNEMEGTHGLFACRLEE